MIDLKYLPEIFTFSVLIISFITILFSTIAKNSSLKTLSLHSKNFTKIDLEIETEKRMYLIRFLASHAVYFGLFGTIFGVINTLMSISNQIDIVNLTHSLAEALAQTGLSIVVAIFGQYCSYFLDNKIYMTIKEWEKENEEK